MLAGRHERHGNMSRNRTPAHAVRGRSAGHCPWRSLVPGPDRCGAVWFRERCRVDRSWSCSRRRDRSCWSRAALVRSSRLRAAGREQRAWRDAAACDGAKTIRGRLSAPGLTAVHGRQRLRRGPARGTAPAGRSRAVLPTRPPCDGTSGRCQGHGACPRGPSSPARAPARAAHRTSATGWRAGGWRIRAARPGDARCIALPMMTRVRTGTIGANEAMRDLLGGRSGHWTACSATCRVRSGDGSASRLAGGRQALRA